MTSTQPKQIDFTIMYATHDAFRRDLDRLATASAAAQADTPQVRAGWDNFKHQLHIHHSVEDTDLWPRLYQKVQNRPADLILLQEMQAEHDRLDRCSPWWTTRSRATRPVSPNT